MSIIMNKEAEITKGILRGFKGIVVGYNRLEDTVDIKLDKGTVVTIFIEYIVK